MRSRDPLSHFRRPSKESAAAKSAGRPEQPGQDVPQWASFFSAAEYQEFVRLVRSFFDNQGGCVGIREGLVHVEGQDSVRLGLGNLAQICHQHGRPEWPALIAAHFGGLAQARQEEQELEAISGDFEKVRPLLAARIYPGGHLKAVGADRLIFREDLEGTITALVFDMPATIRTVPPEQAAPWGKSPEELLAIGIANVRRICRPQLREVNLAPDLVVRIISGMSFLTASHALLLDAHPGCVGRFGTLLGVPHRHAVLCFPIQDRRVIQAVSHLLPAVVAMEKEGPGSISPFLYWYRDGRFLNLPYSESAEGYRFMAPAEFVRALQEMPDAPDRAGGEAQP